MGAKALGVGGPEPRRWLQFTPSVIDERKCMARMWKDQHGNLGAQCGFSCVVGTRFCKRHGKPNGLAHGRVDGDIPDAKFAEFLKASAGNRMKK